MQSPDKVSGLQDAAKPVEKRPSLAYHLLLLMAAVVLHLQG